MVLQCLVKLRNWGSKKAIKSTNGHCDVYINWSIMAYIKVMNQPKMYRSILEKV